MIYSIPDITPGRLAKLAKQIKPVVRNESNALCYIKPCDPREVAFSWDPKITRRANNLVKHATIKTLHRYGYYGYFKPSVAEVLSQITDHLIEHTVAFEVIGPDTTADLNKESEALNQGFHVAVTHLYGRAAR